MTTLPDYYFRARDGGAQVFRVGTDNRLRRIELDQIAVVNMNRGDFKPHADQRLTPADEAAITAWIRERQALVALRDADMVPRAIDHLNLTAHWAQTRATPAELAAVTDALLLAMHDLRSVLIRKKADSLQSPE